MIYKKMFLILSIFLSLAHHSFGAISSKLELTDNTWIHPVNKTKKIIYDQIERGMKKITSGELKVLELEFAQTKIWWKNCEDARVLGQSARYDIGTERVLEHIAGFYESSSLKTIKIASYGEGWGYLALNIPYISDGRKTLEVSIIDNSSMIERSEGTLEIFKEEFNYPSNITFKFIETNLEKSSVLSPNLKENFDISLCMNVLHCLSIHEQEDLLEQISQSCKKDCQVFFSIDCLWSLRGFRKILKEDGGYFCEVKYDFEGNLILSDDVNIQKVSNDKKAYIPYASYVIENNEFVLLKYNKVESKCIADLNQLRNANGKVYHYVQKISKELYIPFLEKFGFKVLSAQRYTFNDPGQTKLGKNYKSLNPFRHVNMNILFSTIKI